MARLQGPISNSKVTINRQEKESWRDAAAALASSPAHPKAFGTEPGRFGWEIFLNVFSKV
jgi:hypothetical protein